MMATRGTKTLRARRDLATYVILASLIAGPPTVAKASVRSQALYARGLVPFANGQWDQAYHLFDQAVHADPMDAMALYYRGLTQARRDRRADAIRDLGRALEIAPSLPHAPLDLGIAYFDNGQYDAARIWLERARQQGIERFTAAFFLGLTAYRMGDDAAAHKYLTEAETDPDLRLAAQYYDGLALLRLGETEAGSAQLTQTVREQPQSEIGRAAQRYLVAQEARQPPSGVPLGTAKPWSVYGHLGFQYDSNVVIAPSDSTIKAAQGISREADGRSVIGLGGAYTWVDSNLGSARVQYDFYQSIHFRLTDFDLQGHRVRLELASRPGRVTYGIAGTYDFYALNYQSFFQEGLGTPWVAFAEGDRAATQLYYTIRGRDFFRDPYDPSRDAIDNAVGFRQSIAWGATGNLLNFGYQFDAENTVAHGAGANDFQYKGHQADIGIVLPLWWRAQAELAYLFRLEDYQFPNSRTNFAFRRHDTEHQFVVALVRPLTPNLSAAIDYLGVINNSNIADFEYDRNVGAVSVTVTF